MLSVEPYQRLEQHLRRIVREHHSRRGRGTEAFLVISNEVTVPVGGGLIKRLDGMHQTCIFFRQTRYVDTGNPGQQQRNRQSVIREITVDASSSEHADQIVTAVKAIEPIQVLKVEDRTFRLHEGGKIEITSRIAVRNQDDLAMAYTPGVGRVCKAIAAEPDRVFDLTMKQNTVAIVTDGSAVLGLGNLGPEGALPVMEGKALLFKEFAGVDAFPVCLATQDTDEIVETVKRIAPVFGGDGSGDGSDDWRKISDLALSPGQTHFIGPVSFTKEHEFEGVSLVLHWAEGEEEPWYLITSEQASWHTLRAYRVRMWTEEMYGDMKGHGFDLEATHLREPERIERLVGLVSVALAWAYRVGEELAAQVPIPVKRHGRRVVSVFRYGLDHLRSLLLGGPRPTEFRRCLRVLSCT